MNLSCCGRFLGGGDTRNRCKINGFVWFYQVGWRGGALEIIAKSMLLHGLGKLVDGRAGHEKSLQNLCICKVLKG